MEGAGGGCAGLVAAGWDDGVRVDAVVGHLAPLCGHGAEEAEGGERADERDEDERLPFAQHDAEYLLYGGRYADDEEAAKLAEVEDKGARYAAGGGDAAAVWWGAWTAWCA